MKNSIISATFLDIMFLVFHMNLILLHLTPPVLSAPLAPIPPDKASLQTWAATTITPLEKREADLDPELVTAEKTPVIIKVRQDGSGDFKTVNEAVKSVPKGNTKRTIIWIGPGTYKEKIIIQKDQPFVTLYGDPKELPLLTFDDSNKKSGTVYSGSVTVWSDYFMGVNLIIENTSPMPKMGSMDGQAVAFTLRGDKAAVYNCKFNGFQDTLCDLSGNHFYKDCFIQGMADFIFGNAKSIYLNLEVKALWDAGGVITAHGKEKPTDDTGYAFIHGSISGVSNGKTYLGRLWKPYGKVVFLYTDMSSVVHPEGWSDNGNKAVDSTLYNGEYMNTGPGANTQGRVKWANQLTDAEAKTYMDLSYIGAAKWLLPIPQVK